MSIANIMIPVFNFVLRMVATKHPPKKESEYTQNELCSGATNLLQKIKQIGYGILLVTGWWEAFFWGHFGDGSSLKGFVFDGGQVIGKLSKQ